MMVLRKNKERGFFDHGWLKTHHSFSFGAYLDRNFMGFGSLRVINEDWIDGGAGFPSHGHQDMEILTYIVEGALEHRDSTGSQGIIRPGEVQKMSAGLGIMHSEFNHLKDQSTHLYQIWIKPDKNGLVPGYMQKDFSTLIASGEPVLIASPEEASGSLPIAQDAKVWVRKYQDKLDWQVPLDPRRLYWLQIVGGEGSVANTDVCGGDGIGLYEERHLSLEGKKNFEVILFDLKKE